MSSSRAAETSTTRRRGAHGRASLDHIDPDESEDVERALRDHHFVGAARYDGLVDFVGAEVCAARDLTLCRIGPYTSPFEVCEERARVSGLLSALAGDDASRLYPERESTALGCPAACPAHGALDGLRLGF